MYSFPTLRLKFSHFLKFFSRVKLVTQFRMEETKFGNFTILIERIAYAHNRINNLFNLAIFILVRMTYTLSPSVEIYVCFIIVNSFSVGIFSIIWFEVPIK